MSTSQLRYAFSGFAAYGDALHALGRAAHHCRAKVMGVTVSEVACGQEAGSTKE